MDNPKSTCNSKMHFQTWICNWFSFVALLSSDFWETFYLLAHILYIWKICGDLCEGYRPEQAQGDKPEMKTAVNSDRVDRVGFNELPFPLSKWLPPCLLSGLEKKDLVEAGEPWRRKLPVALDFIWRQRGTGQDPQLLAPASYLWFPKELLE